MSKWNQLLELLDSVFGFMDKKKSSFRKVAQGYDEKRNEHIILIEYRVRREGEPAVHRRKQRGGGPLLRQINSQAKQQKQRSPQ